MITQRLLHRTKRVRQHLGCTRLRRNSRACSHAVPAFQEAYWQAPVPVRLLGPSAASHWRAIDTAIKRPSCINLQHWSCCTVCSCASCLSTLCGIVRSPALRWRCLWLHCCLQLFPLQTLQRKFLAQVSDRSGYRYDGAAGSKATSAAACWQSIRQCHTVGAASSTVL